MGNNYYEVKKKIIKLIFNRIELNTSELLTYKVITSSYQRWLNLDN